MWVATQAFLLGLFVYAWLDGHDFYFWLALALGGRLLLNGVGSAARRIGERQRLFRRRS